MTHPHLRDFVSTCVLNRTLRCYEDLVDEIVDELFENMQDINASKEWVDDDDKNYQIKEVLTRLVLPHGMFNTEKGCDACDEWTDTIIDTCLAAYNLDAEASNVAEANREEEKALK